MQSLVSANHFQAHRHDYLIDIQTNDMIHLRKFKKELKKTINRIYKRKVIILGFLVLGLFILVIAITNLIN